MKKARRWISLHIFIAGLVLFMHGNRLIEILLVPHFLCAHGEFAHEEQTAQNREPKPETSQAQGKEHPSATPAPPSESSHHHCDAWIFHHFQQDIPHCVAEPKLLALSDYLLKAEIPAYNPIELLILAPKASPPFLRQYN